MLYPAARTFLFASTQGLLEHNFKYQAENQAAALTNLSSDTYSIFTISSQGCSNISASQHTPTVMEQRYSCLQSTAMKHQQARSRTGSKNAVFRITSYLWFMQIPGSQDLWLNWDLRRWIAPPFYKRGDGQRGGRMAGNPTLIDRWTGKRIRSGFPKRSRAQN